MVLTVNRKAEAVLLDANEYDKITNALAMLKILIVGENQIREHKYKSAKDFFKEFRIAHNI